MKRIPLALGLCLVSVAYAAAIPTTWLEARTASQLGITSFNEAPMLAALVASGDLPPVAERLPDDPLVLEPLGEIGTYGGTISASNTGGWSDLGHVRLSYLFTTDPSCSAVIPDIAKGYELSDDGTELTIYLREGMKWSDGAPLTADDVMYFYNDVMLNDEINHWVRFVWTIGGELATFEKLDDYAFRIKMAIPYRPVLSMINHWYTLPSFFMMPSHFAKQFHIDHNPKADELAKELGHENWVDAHSKELNVFPNVDALKKVPTLGTWVMETDVQLKKTFARNPYYHVVDTAGNQLPYIDRVVVNIVSDQQVTILDALQGKSDVAGRLLKQSEMQLYKRGEAQGDYELRNWQRIYAADPGLTFNQNHNDPAKRAVFGDVRFRQAMSLALNRDEMNEFLFLGMGIPQQATIHYGASFYDPAWATNFAEYDPDGARALLDDMGLGTNDDGYRTMADGEVLQINMDVDETNSDSAELIRDYWEAVGVRCRPEDSVWRIDQPADTGQRLRRARVAHRPHAGAALLHPQLHAVRHHLQRVGAEVGRVVPRGTTWDQGGTDRSRAAGRRGAPGRRQGLLRVVHQLAGGGERRGLPALSRRGLAVLLGHPAGHRHGRVAGGAGDRQQPAGERAGDRDLLRRPELVQGVAAGAVVPERTGFLNG